ncbi:MFS transporter, partial [Actinophytocola sp.]|uniref:MFS transporter n=1 Tax=Actinophytocola sp. TaxID=1872138 RepID=UPI0025B7EE5E
MSATRRDWVGLRVLLAATFMGQVDGFVVSVASPSIQEDLHAGFDQIQLVGAGYVLAFAALLVTGARLGDRYGRRRVFLVGVAGFTATSLLCGLAPTAELLIAGRFAQGAAAALMVPQVLAIARAMFTEPADQARAVARYGMVIGLGVVSGVAGGGLLAQADLAGLGWRSVLLVNVPIGLGILVAGKAVGESRGAAGRLDLAGAALTIVGVPALLMPLIFLPGATATAVGLAVAATALGALALRQRRLAAA